MKEVTVRITPDGSAYLLYQDDCPLLPDSPKKIIRASNVKWDERKQGWVVWVEHPLTSLGLKTRLPKYPGVFKRREDAILAEIEVLNRMLAEGLQVEALF